MARENLVEKLHALASKEAPVWDEKTAFRTENRNWLRKSQEIAIKINGVIRELGISQKDLAALLKVSPQQVNKILKGQENLTLETIGKLENALGTTLITIEIGDANLPPSDEDLCLAV